MIYRLSNNQRKELLVRGTPLAIAIPAPFSDPEDWLAWAKQSLGDEGQYVHKVPEVMMLPVGPPNTDSGLASIIGNLATATEQPFHWLVEVAIVELDPPLSSRHKRSKVQWPGSVDTETAAGVFPRQKQ